MIDVIETITQESECLLETFRTFKPDRSRHGADGCPLQERREIGRIGHLLLAEKKRGARIAETLAVAFDMSPSDLYQHVQYFELFTEAEVDKLCAADNKWRAVAAVLRVKNRTTRNRLLRIRKQYFEADWCQHVRNTIDAERQKLLADYRKGRTKKRPSGQGVWKRKPGVRRSKRLERCVPGMEPSALITELEELARHAAGLGVEYTPDHQHLVARVAMLVVTASTTMLITEDELKALQYELKAAVRCLADGTDAGTIARDYVRQVRDTIGGGE